MNENVISGKVMEDNIKNKIISIRGYHVILDRDLAELYGVENKYLKRQVRRNIERFPGDFMFELTNEESSRCQNVTLKRGGNIKHLPFAFTRDGILMLSSVLRSKIAIQTNIRIIKVLNRLLDKEQQNNNNTIEAIYKISNDSKDDIQNLDNRLEKYQKTIRNRQDMEGKELWKAIRALQRKIIGI